MTVSSSGLERLLVGHIDREILNGISLHAVYDPIQGALVTAGEGEDEGKFRLCLRPIGIGRWIAGYPDGSAACVFAEEIDALRWAVEHSATVAWMSDGCDAIQTLRKPKPDDETETR